MKQIWKLAAAGFFLTLFAAAICGCMSKEDRQIAKRNEQLGKGMVRTYVREHYGEQAQIIELTCLDQLKDSGPIPDFFDHPSDYVKATVRGRNGEFQVLMNVRTQEGYDNRYQEQIKRSAHSFFASRIDLPEPRRTDVYYYSKEIGELPRQSIEGFAEPGLRQFDQLLYQDNYQANVVYQYVDTDLDFLRGAGQKLLLTERDIGDVTVGFANFWDEFSMYQSSEDGLGKNQVAEDLTEQNQKIKEVYVVSRKKYYDWDTETERYDDAAEEEYHLFRKLPLQGGIELVYDTECYEITMEQVKAPDTVTSMGQNFYDPLSPQYQLKISRKKAVDQNENAYEDIMLYFPAEFAGDYLVSEENGEEDWNKVSWERSGVYYDYFYTYEDHTDMAFSLYGKKEERS